MVAGRPLHRQAARAALPLRIAAISALALYGAAALLSGSDRVSASIPSAPAFLGWPYDTGASRSQAIRALAAKQPEVALALARRALLSDPVDSRLVSLVGQGQLVREQYELADQTFRVAGQLGWRDGAVQIYWMDRAVAVNDFRVAAERLDALLRQAPRFEERDTMIAALTATPEGRAAVAERLKLAPAWADYFVGEVHDLPKAELEQRVDVMNKVGPGVWSCATAARMGDRLIAVDMLQPAQGIWRRNCGASGSLVYDGAFDKLDTTRSSSAFDWRLSERSDVLVEATQDAKGNRLMGLKVSGSFSQPVLRQLMVLSPGRYRVTWDARDRDGAPARGLSVSLDCRKDARDAAPGQGTTGRFAQDFAVDDSCSAPTLTFWLEPRQDVLIDNVALKPL